MIHRYKAILLFIIAVFFLSACSASFEEEQKEVKQSVEAALKEKPKQPKHKYKEIQFYLPFGVEIEKETPNNIILKSGSKTYILFYNQHESSNSDVVYQSTIQQKEKYEVNQTYKNDNQFGYLLIKKLDDEMNELTVGIGGVKITTEAKTKNMSSEASMMVQIVNSVKPNR